MNTYRILIVEDEILIADTIERYLSKQGHEIIGSAISFKEAQEIYLKETPDLALLDIRLSGEKSGIDFAHFMQEQADPRPFIYLTSQLDSRSIDSAKKTFPAGYLSKPIQKETLFTTIEIAMHSHRAKAEEPKLKFIKKGHQLELPIKEIEYLKADHIYVRIQMSDNTEVVQRATLMELMEQLPPNQFVQSHRSFLVNINKVTGWDQNNIQIGQKVIPLSRTRRKELIDLLQAR